MSSGLPNGALYSYAATLPFIVLVACAPAAGPAVTPPSDASAVRAYVEQANARFVDAFNRADAAALADMYTPDAVVLAPNAPPMQGQQNIQGLWTAARQQMGARTLALETTSVEVSGNQAVEVGNYTMTLQPQGGPDMMDRGKYMVVWRRQPDGSWKLHRDMFNTSMPMQASAINRATQGDTVWVILNYVKADKRQQFERFLHEVFWPGGKRVGQTDPVVARTFGQTRILHPAGPNRDGTYTYAFIMDPLLSGAEYGIENLLKRAYPAAESERHMRLFDEALARRGEMHRLVQSRD